MKKKILLLFLIIYGINLYCQELDSIPQPGFSFTLGTKVTIQLVPIDSVNYNYRVIKFEAYHENIDLDNDKKLLSDSIDEDKIEFVFNYGFYGNDKTDKENNLKIVLELRSGSISPIEYNADIQVPNKDFELTSVVPLPHMSINREFWPYQIDAIALHSFRKYKNSFK
jgi:hypothetical protein